MSFVFIISWEALLNFQSQSNFNNFFFILTYLEIFQKKNELWCLIHQVYVSYFSMICPNSTFPCVFEYAYLNAPLIEVLHNHRHIPQPRLSLLLTPKQLVTCPATLKHALVCSYKFLMQGEFFTIILSFQAPATGPLSTLSCSVVWSLNTREVTFFLFLHLKN